MRSKSCSGGPAPHKKIKLIMGFIFKDEWALEQAETLISRRFGPIDFRSGIVDFPYTDYYSKELGLNLKRKFISLTRLISPENIYLVKLRTCKIEKKLSISGRRTVNIDPGYMAEGKLVLLTTKDHSHRVYLRNGVYAESTLKFHGGTFVPWETTYPDYGSAAYVDIFKQIRNLYKENIAYK